MGLSNALNIGTNALLAHQAALNVVGDNISNASNPERSRQRVEFTALPGNRYGQLFFGAGVGIKDVRRVFDQQVENRLQRALSTKGSLARQNDAYEQLETAMNVLGDDTESGLFVSVGGQLDQIFNQLQSLASNASDPSLRSITVSQFDSLASTISKLAEDVRDLRTSFNESIEASVRDINVLIKEIAELNGQIVKAEIGGAISGQANTLRDRRDFLVRNLAEKANVQVNETSTGAVDIRVNGELLVSGNDYFALETVITADRGVEIANVEFALSGGEFRPREGELGGLLIARDDILTSFQSDLDGLARTVINRFNQVHSTGRGLTGLKSVQSNPFTATHALNSELPISMQGTVSHGNNAGTFLVDPNLMGYPAGAPNSDHFVGAKVLFTSGPNEGRTATITAYEPGTGRLDLQPPLLHGIEAGDTFEITSFDYPVENGSFKLNLRNDSTGITDVFDIQIDRDGLPTPPNIDDTTLQEMVDDINTQLSSFYSGNSPVTARITDDFRLEIVSTESEVSFSFSDDTSGFLAAAGINTLFSGNDAFTMALSEQVRDNPALLATATSAFEGDNSNVQRMLDVFNEKLFLGDTTTIQEFYRGVVGTVSVEAATAKELATNQELIAQAAQNARERISGVNIDEEAIDLIKYQRAFQAASRYISVVDELLETLIAIV